MHLCFVSNWLIWNVLEIFFKTCYENLKHFNNISTDELQFFIFENSLISSPFETSSPCFLTLEQWNRLTTRWSMYLFKFRPKSGRYIAFKHKIMEISLLCNNLFYFKILITDNETYDEKFQVSFYLKTHPGRISSDHSLRYSFVTN